jgi:hypothetical protein
MGRAFHAMTFSCAEGLAKSGNVLDLSSGLKLRPLGAIAVRLRF